MNEAELRRREFDLHEREVNLRERMMVLNAEIERERMQNALEIAKIHAGGASK